MTIFHIRLQNVGSFSSISDVITDWMDNKISRPKNWQMDTKISMGLIINTEIEKLSFCTFLNPSPEKSISMIVVRPVIRVRPICFDKWVSFEAIWIQILILNQNLNLNLFEYHKKPLAKKRMEVQYKHSWISNVNL